MIPDDARPQDNLVRQEDSLLETLVGLIDYLPTSVPPAKRGRGCPRKYSDRLFLKALVIMIVRRLHHIHELLTVLHQPTPQMQRLRQNLCEDGRFPSRRTFERRLATLPTTLPAQIGCLGRYLVDIIQPWQSCGRAVALDSTVLRARGGVWHTKDKEAGLVPHTSIDTEAGWTKSGWHGWVFGWKLHLACVVADAWIPLAADLTPANVADGQQALCLLAELPLQTRLVLGDRHYNTPAVEAACCLHGRTLVATRYGRYPHTDPGVEVRRVFHKLRSVAIENFNEHFKGIFEGHSQVPTKGQVNTQRFVLGCVLVYQLALWHRYEQKLPLNIGLKAYLKAA